ncbi:fluoride efflux transporter CrcB [Gallaecimonas xiamenensis]|uniref:Fluoride-specific ion channel FluC n=1 Tax=Gallaecimonas xiamenensis 3-C-1 TaxID=745411 RepID=K2J9U6_9GAMM|nr:fluoride efflux transporter CrcB [Gallaecimonas xiamenensis]EKE67234.1 camphor resistance protein CrcB [Gallaecimonas xiamenensis 3-C-1]
MQGLLFVAMGGAVGAMLRFGISEFCVWLLGRGFPYGTLLVNTLGSFLMGILMGLVFAGHIDAHPWRQLIGLGFLGALTTYSTFAMDNVLLLQQGDFLKAGLNIFLNVSLTILLALAGMALVRQNL